MTDRKLIVPALAGVLSLGAIAQAAEPTAAELRSQLEQLQAKIEKVEAKQSADAQQAATSRELTADAATRSQLLQSEGVVAGFNKGFFIQSADGAFKLQPFFQFQFRSVTNYRDNAGVNGDDDSDTQNGFEIRRMKFGFKGNAISKDLTYEFRWATSRTSGSPVLENAYIQYKFADDFAFKVGQWKDNVFHEETTSSQRQLTVDRSLLNELLGGGQTDYVQGVSLLYLTDAVHAELALTDGANSDNTDFTEGGGGTLSIDGPNYGVSGRVEYKVLGDWHAYDDFTAMGNKDDLLVVGGGFDYTEGGDAYALYHTADVQWEPASVVGLAVYGAYVANYNDSGDGGTSYDWGFLGQAGFMINEQFEIFGRYDFIRIDTDADEDTFHEITVGGNYYFYGHNAKATVDLTYLPSGSPTSESGIGVLASDDSQFIIRGQFQLAF